MSALLLVATLYPLLLFAVFAWRPPQHYSRWWIVSAPLPALMLSIGLPDTIIQLPFLLLGVVWELNPFTRPLLMMTALLWLVAGYFALGYMQADGLRRFTLCWLATLVGNLSLVLGKDIASFYTGFALMTFAGYGLVVHQLSAEALRAGKIYIAMAVLGEVLILSGFILLIPDLVEPMLHYVPLAIAEHDYPILVSLLLFAGFGVKAGVLGLHFWLPLAHPVAPTPASAVLSGAMIKAGLIAWVQVLPLGAELAAIIEPNVVRGVSLYDAFAWLVIGLGLSASFLAAVLGALQLKPKAVLAYSSISQMGLMTTLIGVALLMPELWSGVLVALVAFIVHHGLAKGALFLGVGLVEQPGPLPRWAVLVLLLVPALSLIGVPLSSGGAAKYLLKGEAYATGIGLLTFLLTFSAAATALLMLRFIDLLYGQMRKVARGPTAPSGPPVAREPTGVPEPVGVRAAIQIAAILSVVASAVLIWWFPIELYFTSTLNLIRLWETLWPMTLAIGIYLSARRWWPASQT